MSKYIVISSFIALVGPIALIGASQEGCEINFSNSNLTDDVLSVVLERSTGIVTLNLNATSVTDISVCEIKKQVRIRNLVLSNTRITENSLHGLKNLVTLESLDVSSNRNIDDRAVKIISEVKSLQTLNLAETSVSNQSIEFASAMKELRALVLQKAKISGSCFKSLNKLVHLQELDLASSDINDGDLVTLANDNIRRLNLSHTKITDLGFKDISKRMPGLRYVSVGGCFNVTEIGVFELAGLPKTRDNQLPSDWGLTGIAKGN